MSSPNNNTPTPPGDGLSILDLENLPKPQYRVMRVVMRERECTHARLLSLLEAEEMPKEDFEAALAELLKQQWLVKVDEFYKANLRRKNARILSEFQPTRRATPSLRGIWDSLEKDDKK
jgi:hypothetical protein